MTTPGFLPDRPPPSPDSQPGGRAVGAAPRTPGRALECINSAPELAQRRQAERSRMRVLVAAGGFLALFAAVGGQLVKATVVAPSLPRPRAELRLPPAEPPRALRARIVDRNGRTLASSVPSSALVADPKAIGSPANAAQVADRLLTVFPDMNREALVARLTPHNVPGTDEPARFVYVRHDVTKAEHERVMAAGAFGIEFRSTERRVYPQGRAAAHVLGQVVDLENVGVAGVELTFDRRLRSDPAPLRLALDIRVQQALRDAVDHAIRDFSGIGGAGILLDINSAEVLGMVSLPDYDANDPGAVRFCGPELERENRLSNRCERFNRVISGVYEPGSTFKLLTAAMALEYGTAGLGSSFDASRPIQIGRFTIKDYKGKNRWLSFAEVIQHSSNLGAAHLALGVGTQRHREFLARAGLLERVEIELPGSRAPLVPGPQRWRDVNTMTIGYGHGIAVTPLHVITAVSAVANGGMLRQPTILAQPADEPRPGTRIISQRNSEQIRRLMRLVVTDGSGRAAEVPGYFVGGKTGTAEKIRPGGGYVKDKRIAAFVGAFPMQAPRYAVYVMVDEPNPNARSQGHATAGWVAAPATHEVVRRVAPILGLVPETERQGQIQQTMAVPPVVPRPARPAPAPPAPQRAAPAHPSNVPALPGPATLRRAEADPRLRLVAVPEVPIAPR
jgi:cell division protein FtsI (penicillin-binding protein 3)